MPLDIGLRLGPYEILAQLGAGGMGEVYKARDTRLDRTVAIKVLPAHIAAREDLRARFEREARAVSSLNHPHICTLHDIGKQDAIDFMVMEHLEGETLFDRLQRGPLPLDQTLKYAMQIADAVDRAHRSGVVHRDLKPGNIMITRDGVKVLDFGLAKTAPKSAADGATMTMALTSEGTVLGTAQYMSPEQISGGEIDARSDIFAFGCVLYEMVTGKRAFDGKNKASVIGVILAAEPAPMSTLQPVAPRQLERTVARCLAKEPEDRWQSLRDVLLELRSIAEAPSIKESKHSPPRRDVWGWIAAGVAALALAALASVHFREAPPVERALRLSVALPKNSTVMFHELSPDGRKLALVLTGDGPARIYIRSLDSEDLQPLSGTDLARTPFWSPDSRFLGFVADGKLKVIPAAGGPAQVLCEETGIGRGGTWNREGLILFGNEVGPLRRVNANGGPCSGVGKDDPDARAEMPVFLPDGNHFLYLRADGVYLASLDEPVGRKVISDRSSVVFAPPSKSGHRAHLLFLRENTLMAQPFDDKNLQPVGDPLTVSPGASNAYSPRQVAASASATGILVYVAGRSRDTQLTWFDRTGKELAKVGPSGPSQRGLVLSPDGNGVVINRGDQNGSTALWLHDLVRGSDSRLTPPTNDLGGAPIWSPDSTLLWVSRVGPEGRGIYQTDLKGGQVQLVDADVSAPRRVLSDWSRDGRFLIYTMVDSKTRADVWYVPVESGKPGRKAVKLVGTDAIESQGQLSPDGKWLAYYSDETGKGQIYVRSFPGGSRVWTVSIDGGREPRWRSDGKELFFAQGTQTSWTLMAAAVESDGAGGLRIGTPQKLFGAVVGGVIPQANAFAYSPHPDGQRFLVNARQDREEPTVNVITNWHKVIGEEAGTR